jgi:hypothetical protein
MKNFSSDPELHGYFSARVAMDGPLRFSRIPVTWVCEVFFRQLTDASLT